MLSVAPPGVGGDTSKEDQVCRPDTFLRACVSFTVAQIRKSEQASALAAIVLVVTLKTASLAPAFVITLSLAGCAGGAANFNPPTQSTATVTVTAPAPATSETGVPDPAIDATTPPADPAELGVPDEAAYLAAMRKRGGPEAGNDDATLLDMGGNLCLLLSYHAQGQQTDITTPMLTGAKASGLLKVVTRHLCPEQAGTF